MWSVLHKIFGDDSEEKTDPLPSPATEVKSRKDEAEKYKYELHNYINKIAIPTIAERHSATERYVSNYLYYLAQEGTEIAPYFDNYENKSISIKPTEKIKNIKFQIDEIEIEIEQLKRKAAKYGN